MKATRLAWLGLTFSLVIGMPVGAQVEVIVEALDVGGNPPGLEGLPGVFLTNQDTGTEHLVVFGGCTEDSLWDQALVLDDVSGGFDDLMWRTVPVPGMGAACEHVVAGPGDMAYLIGGYHNDFTTMRPMDEILEISLSGTVTNPVIETTPVDISCTECPESRVGHGANWVDEFEGCAGGAVVIAGGMNDQWQMLDDVWSFCTESNGRKDVTPAEWKSVAHMLMPGVMSDFGYIFHPGFKAWYAVGPSTNSQGQSVLAVWRYDRERETWDPLIWEATVSGRWGFTIVPTKTGIDVIGGTRTVDGVNLREVWGLNFIHKAWYPQDLLERPSSNHVRSLFRGVGKQGGVSRSLLFGGVEDWATRTLSNTTYLVTTTEIAPPADYAVPAVARVQGSGAFFTSIMHLFNAGDSDLEVEMVFTPRAGSGGDVTTINHTVPAGVLQTIQDPLEALFGFSGTAGRVGSVLITVTSGSVGDLMVQTVVFARLDTGEEYGQFFPALRVADAIDSGQKAYLSTTEDPGTNRVNVGLMAVANGTRFRVTPVDPLGSGLAAARTYDLDQGGNTQINNIHSTFGLGTMANVMVEVEVLAGSGLSYASVLDGNIAYDGTSDPTTILPLLGGNETVTLLEIGSIQGINEFSGSASITNYSATTASVQADFLQRGVGGVTATETITIPAGDTVGYTDLAGDLFGVFGDVGTVVLSATNNTVIGATGREFAIFRDGGDIVGTAGQLIAGQTDGDRLAPGTTHHFIGLRQAGSGSAVERSHFAVYNPTPFNAEVTVRLYDGATGSFEGEGAWTIASRTLIQVNSVIRLINPGHDDGEKRIEVETTRPVYMNAFRVNRWGDPVTLNAFEGGS